LSSRSASARDLGGRRVPIHGDPTQKVGFDADAGQPVRVLELGQLIIAVIGAMAITSEYSTGMIRTR